MTTHDNRPASDWPTATRSNGTNIDDRIQVARAGLGQSTADLVTSDLGLDDVVVSGDGVVPPSATKKEETSRPLPDSAMFHGLLGEVIDTLARPPKPTRLRCWCCRRISDGSLAGYRMGPRLIRVDLNEMDALLTPIPTVGNGAPVA